MALKNKTDKTKDSAKKAIEEVSEKYNVDLLSLFSKDKNECNQCHGNCDDCGYDR